MEKTKERKVLVIISTGSHLDYWVRTPHILDGKAGIPRWSLALDERRNLWQTSSILEK